VPVPRPLIEIQFKGPQIPGTVYNGSIYCHDFTAAMIMWYTSTSIGSDWIGWFQSQ